MVEAAEKSPRIFLSYSHDSSEHKEWVLGLASQLVQAGIDVILDQWDLEPGDDLAFFMERSVTSSDRVILVCSGTYVEKANAGRGGVGYEKMIVTSELMEKLDTRKFIPIVRNAGPEKLPSFLGSRLYIDFDDDALQEPSLEQLIRAIHDTPKVSKPQIGRNPYGETDSASIDSSSVSNGSGKNTALQPEERRIARQKLEECLRTLESIETMPQLPNDPVDHRWEKFRPLASRVLSLLKEIYPDLADELTGEQSDLPIESRILYCREGIGKALDRIDIENARNGFEPEHAGHSHAKGMLKGLWEKVTAGLITIDVSHQNPCTYEYSKLVDEIVLQLDLHGFKTRSPDDLPVSSEIAPILEYPQGKGEVAIKIKEVVDNAVISQGGIKQEVDGEVVLRPSRSVDRFTLWL